MDPMIRLHNIEKFYEAGYGKTFVLRRITLDIKEGEFVTIMGPSGAGKSTLLSILGIRFHGPGSAQNESPQSR